MRLPRNWEEKQEKVNRLIEKYEKDTNRLTKEITRLKTKVNILETKLEFGSKSEPSFAGIPVIDVSDILQSQSNESPAIESKGSGDTLQLSSDGANATVFDVIIASVGEQDVNSSIQTAKAQARMDDLDKELGVLLVEIARASVKDKVTKISQFTIAFTKILQKKVVDEPTGAVPGEERIFSDFLETIRNLTMKVA